MTKTWDPVIIWVRIWYLAPWRHLQRTLQCANLMTEQCMYNNDYSVYRNEKNINSDKRMKMPLRGYHRKCLMAHYVLYNLLDHFFESRVLVLLFIKGQCESIEECRKYMHHICGWKCLCFPVRTTVWRAIKMYGRAPLLPTFSSPSLYTENPRLLIKYPLLACHLQG